MAITPVVTLGRIGSLEEHRQFGLSEAEAVLRYVRTRPSRRE
jgi:hypothetical protein